MDNKSIRRVTINPDTETAVSGRVSRTRHQNLVAVNLPAQQASRGLRVREIVHFYRQKGWRAAAPHGGPQSSSDQYGIVWIGSLKSAAGPPVFGGGCTAFAVVGVDDVPCQPAIGRSGV